MSKLSIVAAVLAFSQLMFFVILLAVGWSGGITDAVPWNTLVLSIGGAWAAALPLAALQMLVSVMWSSFAAPLAVNVIFTIPNLLIIQSRVYGPYYPWAQPALSMIPSGQHTFGTLSVSYQTLIFVVISSLFLFFIIGLTYFRVKEIT